MKDIVFKYLVYNRGDFESLSKNIEELIHKVTLIGNGWMVAETITPGQVKVTPERGGLISSVETMEPNHGEEYKISVICAKQDKIVFSLKSGTSYEIMYRPTKSSK